MQFAKGYDFILIGAGSAGCVLAEKLSQTHTVLLLEAGGNDRRFWIQTPMGYGKTFYDAAVNWKFSSAIQQGLNGRTIYIPRGKVLGGSSSINAMVYHRGLPHDFDDWQKAASPAWGWSEALRTYRSFEHHLDSDGNSLSKPDTDPEGFLYISDIAKQLHPIHKVYFEAAKTLGLPYNADIYGDTTEGVAHYRLNTYRGKRWSSAQGFLRPALKRKNIQLCTQALVERVLIRAGRAVGVRFKHAGEVHDVSAHYAVVLCAGAIQSPQLLELSGIGDAQRLQRYGIGVNQHLPAVGEHLQDHLAMSYTFCSNAPTLNQPLGSWYGKLWQGVRYLLTRRGLLALSVNQLGGFVRSHEQAAYPDLQLYCNPISYSLTHNGKVENITTDSFYGFILCFQPCRPQSLGSVHIQSASIADAPLIDPRYLAVSADIETALRGAQLMQRFLSTPAMQGYIVRSVGHDLINADAATMIEDFRNRASTCYHPVGTCRMGNSPQNSVVDHTLKVHGMDALYVADASIFPNITSGNTHAPTVMVAHKAAQILLNTYA